MRSLARAAQADPDVRRLAHALASPAAVDAFLRESWRFVPDPEDEYIQTPARQLDGWMAGGDLTGDCDDAATLAASLLLALDWPCSLIAIRMPGDFEYSHVFLRCPVSAAGTLDIDPIVPAASLPITGVAESMEVPI